MRGPLVLQRIVVRGQPVAGTASPSCETWGSHCSFLGSQRADLETVFLTLTGRSVRNA